MPESAGRRRSQVTVVALVTVMVLSMAAPAVAAPIQIPVGPGVVGEEPVLNPGESFRYTSGAALPTARGTMRGSYQMHRADGAMFDAEIAEFLLERPYSLN